MQPITTYTSGNFVYNDDSCSLCLSSPIVLPITFPCSHMCCMRCYTKNGGNISMSCCPLCREPLPTFKPDSPVFQLQEDIDVSAFYNLFTRGTLIQTTNKQDLVGKFVVITKDVTYPGKNFVFKQSLIGHCEYVNGTYYRITNGFAFDRMNMVIYPTSPTERTYIFESTDLLYYVNEA